MQQFKRGDLVQSNVTGFIIMVDEVEPPFGFSGTVISAPSHLSNSVGQYSPSWKVESFKRFTEPVTLEPPASRKTDYYWAAFPNSTSAFPVFYAGTSFYICGNSTRYTENDFRWISDEPMETKTVF